ncbi:DoxX family protein [Streptomyces sp. NPDC054804]
MPRASPAADTAPAPSSNPERAAARHAAARSQNRATLILPAALNIVTALTPLAATGLTVTMILAMGFHTRHKDPRASR